MELPAGCRARGNGLAATVVGRGADLLAGVANIGLPVDRGGSFMLSLFDVLKSGEGGIKSLLGRRRKDAAMAGLVGVLPTTSAGPAGDVLTATASLNGFLAIVEGM